MLDYVAVVALNVVVVIFFSVQGKKGFRLKSYLHIQHQ